MNIILLLIGLLNLGLLIYFLQRSDDTRPALREMLEDHEDHLTDQLDYRFEKERQASQITNQQLEIALTDRLTEMRVEIHQQTTALRAEMNEHFTKNRDKTDERMQHRLQTSFETVSKQLESVNKGLGEMQTVARDVGTLNKVLSNTKTRGIMGELQLGQIIEDILTPAQYEREFVTVPQSSERVEYAIKLPGQGEEPVYLPIDSKFPLEDYYRLEEAYESGEKEEIERYRKALLASIKRFAKDIQQKYLFPPATTNFGILFLPTEGLYSEVVRNPEFFDRLRRDEQILVAGPSTLSALLNSLSVGFKTLNIQKSADDISKVLGSVKSEFHKFGGILAKTQRHLKNASNNIDDLLTRRTSAIERTLRQIESDEDLLGLDVYIEDGEDDGQN